MLKVGGLWVSPIEVEHALVDARSGAGMRRRGARRSRRAGQARGIRRACGPDIDATPTLADELLAHVRAMLADYKRPRWIQFVTELPKTATGKIQRHKLRDRTGAQ